MLLVRLIVGPGNKVMYNCIPDSPFPDAITLISVLETEHSRDQMILMISGRNDLNNEIESRDA